MILAISIIALVLTALPAAMFFANLPLFCVPSGNSGSSSPISNGDSAGTIPTVSVLVPARDEESGIGDCVHTSLRSTDVVVEIVVLDDNSSDSTAAIVDEISQSDQRVRLIHGAPLPSGWNGKQYACKQLADAARYERFAFIDADVRLEPDAMRRLIDYQDETGVGLLSAFPHQTTGTWLEAWIIPMMHFILLGYLPFSRMRSNADPSLAAGCGQLFLTKRDAYDQAGTHEAIKQSRHDGVKLPRAYRSAGVMTDVIDGTDIADCRMYRGASEVIRGALKNATEGIASPRLIIIFTVLLLGCSVLPLLAFVLSIRHGEWIPLIISVIALGVAHLPRFVAAKRLRQSWFGAACHIPATLSFLILQWIALANQLRGHQVAWRGRLES